MIMKKIGYNGSAGAYSHIASEVLTPTCEYIGFADFYSCFENLKNGILDEIVIPIENSYAGRVADVHRLISSYDIYFNQELILPILHQLMAIDGVKLDEIEEIYSHEQAIWQCEANLKQFFHQHYNRDVKFVKYHDTAMAAEFVKNENSHKIAAIASKKAAQINNLTIIKPDVNDVMDNFTNFILMSKTQKITDFHTAKNYVTSIIFEIGNGYGSLSSVLNIFTKYNINLYKIESYIPGAVKSESARFFISIAGHVSSNNVKNAMQELSNIVKSHTILGCYEADDRRI